MRSSLSDEELVEHIKSGDERAFDQLFKKYQEVVRGYLRGKLKKEEDVEDAVVETFTGAHKNIGSFRGDTSVQRWLISIAHKKAVSIIRKRASIERKEVLVEKRMGDRMEEDGRSIESLADASPSQLDVLIERLESDALDEAIETLDEPFRTTVFLKVREGMSNPEIGERMGCDRATVWRRLKKGLKEIQERLARVGNEHMVEPHEESIAA